MRSQIDFHCHAVPKASKHLLSSEVLLKLASRQRFFCVLGRLAATRPVRTSMLSSSHDMVCERYGEKGTISTEGNHCIVVSGRVYVAVWYEWS